MFGLGREPDRVIKRGSSRQQPESQSSQQDTTTKSSGGGLSPQELYNHAKSIYEQTRDP